MKKKLLAFACVAAMSVSAVPTFGAESIKVLVNDFEVVFQGQQPVIVDGYTLVPVRGALEAMGVQVTWNEEEKSVLLAKDGKEAKLVIGEKEFQGGENDLETPAQIIGGSTMIPLRAVAECFDGQVSWDGNSKTVSVAMDKKVDAYSAVTYKKDLNAEDGKELIYGSIKYPQLNAEVLGEKANVINEKIAAAAKGSLEAYLTEMKEQVESDRNVMGEDFKVYGFTITFDNFYYDDDIVSFYSSKFIYTGGAHGNTYAQGYTYDLKTGEEKKLADFVSLENNMTENEYLKSIVKEDIKKDSEKYFENAEKRLDENSDLLDFYMKGKNELVVITTAAGDISPYAVGIAQIEKSLAE